MSRHFFRCAFCGLSFAAEGTICPWQSEFRALYSGRPGTVKLTGVGVCDWEHFWDPAMLYIAPPDPSGRWDDPGYDRFNREHLIHQLYSSPEYGRAFLVHDACWRIFSESAHVPPSTRLEPLFEVLNSLLMDHNMLRWNHDYGGILKVQSESRYPWEPMIIEEMLDSWDLYLLKSPMGAEEVLGVLIEPEDRKSQDKIRSRRKRVKSSSNWRRETDRLFKLPAELILLISTLLPTADFFNARLASRAFWSPFYNRTFWLSRFLPGRERSWLYEIRQKSPQDRKFNPQLVYRCTAEHRLQEEDWFKNRRRIYDLVSPIHPLLNLQWVCFSTLPALLNTDQLVWRKAVPDVCVRTSQVSMPHTWPLIETGARETRTFESHLPYEPVWFIFYFCTIGPDRYLCGMRIAPVSQPGRVLVEFGHRSRDIQQYSMPTGSRLIGCGVAFRNWAVQGIQIHYIDQFTSRWCTSDWYGDCHDSIRSVRAITDSGAFAIRAGFQGCKMVSLHVAEAADLSPEEAEPKARTTLRQRAIWHPDIPGPELSLNESCFPEAETYKENLNPLFWTLFGGRGGERLSQLTSIDVLIDVYIVGIRFGYNDNVAEQGVGTTELGRHGRDEFNGGLGSFQVVPESVRIEGPKGERIVCIRTRQQHPKRRDMDTLPLSKLKELEFITNWNRSMVFVDESWEGNEDYCDEHFLSPDPGTTITGFYAHQSNFGRLISCLGILSEPVSELTL